MSNKEDFVRLSAFMISLALLGFLEIYFKRRAPGQNKIYRWKVNISLALINSLGLKLLSFISPVLVARTVSSQGYGFLNQFDLQDLWKGVVTFLFLDVLIYWQHRIFHRVPALWSLHLVHHSDKDLDVSTGFRFHPVEMILSMMIKLAGVVVIGGSPEGVFAAELALSLGALFSHANINLGRADKFIQVILVSPDMHRVHHGLKRQYCDTNFGFSLSLWDRLFRTYYDSDKVGHQNIVLGGSRSGICYPFSLTGLLKAPFAKKR